MPREGLNPVLGCENENRAADVVFVHGLDGDAITTWQADKDPANFWPRWLGETDASVGVWTLSYAVSSSAWKGHSMPLADRAKWTLDQLDLKKLGRRPIMFICHSLGGLLVKECLKAASGSKDPGWRSILLNTRSVLFLSTPHSGADLANWLGYLGTLLRNTVSVDELEAHHPRLRELNEWYRDNAPDLGIATFVYCEKLPTNGVLVVDESTADPGIPGVRPVPLDEDHRSICKPSSRQSAVFERARRLLEDQLLRRVLPAGVSSSEDSSETLLRLWADVNGSWIRVRQTKPNGEEPAYFTIAFENCPGSYPANATFRFWGAEPLINQKPPTTGEVIKSAGSAEPGQLSHGACDLEVRLAEPCQTPLKISFRIIDNAGRQWSYAKGDSYLMETVTSGEWLRVRKLELTKKLWRPFEADGTEHTSGTLPDFSRIRGFVIEVGGPGNPSRPAAGSGVLDIRGFRLCD